MASNANCPHVLERVIGAVVNRPPNNRIKRSVRPVTAVALATAAPVRPAAYAVR